MTLQSQKVLTLERTFSWAVTGTPIQNNIQDLQALLQLIRLDPLMQPEWWRVRKMFSFSRAVLPIH
jgi:SNF2 family DNA or RNA helicase